MNNNVELCSDWLFHSAAHFSSLHSRKETQGGKNIFQYFLSQLYRRVIILYIFCICSTCCQIDEDVFLIC